MIKYIKYILVIFGLILSSAVMAQSESDFFWYHYIVDTNTPTGAFTSLDFDSQGFPHIAYTDRADVELGKGVKYAHFDGIRWTIEEIDATGGGRLELVLDSNDQPHIVYGNNNQSTIMYATKKSGDWVLLPLLTSMSVGQANYDRDIQTIDGDIVHIIFATDNDPRPNTEYSVVYVSVVNGVASEPYRIKNGIVGKWSSMTLGEDNNPAVAFWDNSGDLFFANFDGSQWNVDNVDNDGYDNHSGFYPSMVYGADKNYYIAFQSHNPKMIRIAIGQPGNWRIEDVVDLPRWELYEAPSPMVMDENNTLFIAYYDVDNSDLILLRQEGNVWSSSVVDSSDTVGQHASMAINSEGLPSISYYNGTSGYLKYVSASMEEFEDRDNDLLPDYIELLAGLSSSDMDFDDDGLSDGEEDQNKNGILDVGESDPKLFDTDGDGLSDGVEAGRTSGITGSAGIAGSDRDIFVPDSDPITRTNYSKFDTDGDGLGDGVEDVNLDGRMDEEETDPNNPDTDSDGLNDWGELNLYTSPFDMDSDNDGISDGDEDANNNMEIDAGETSPWLFDSDNDGLNDGMELGIVEGIADPDGNGRLKATRDDIFIPDANPATRTNPLKWDSDDDGLGDSEEDVNKNGSIEAGETDPSKWDTDGDGAGDGDEIRFGTDPLDPSEGVIVDPLFSETFADVDLNGWTIVDDGDIEGPSNWIVHQNSLYQLSNIHDGVDNYDSTYCMRGSYIWAGDKNWQDYVISFKMKFEDDDAAGIMFRYVDKDNYYRISMSKELGKIWCIRFLKGECQIIEEKPFDYELGPWYDVRLNATGSDFSLKINGELVLNANDENLKNGAFAFYTWKNAGVGFSSVDVVRLQIKVDVERSVWIEDEQFLMQGDKRVIKMVMACPSDITTVTLQGRRDDGSYDVVDAKSPLISEENGPRNFQFIDDQPWAHEAYRLLLKNSYGDRIMSRDMIATNNYVKDFALLPSYPNPFSNQTTLRVYTGQPLTMNYAIYNILGQIVFSGTRKMSNAGWDQFSWDGKDAAYRLAPNGVYFIQLNFMDANSPGNTVKTLKQKIILTR